MIDAAVKVVAKRGFDGAPVDEIARTAGFSIGALYGNFAGKDDLFLAVYDAHVRWFEQELGALDLGDPAAALAAAFAVLRQGVEPPPGASARQDAAAAVIASWSLVHGLATLALSGNLDKARVRDLAGGDLLDLARRSTAMLHQASGPSAGPDA